MKGIHRPLGFAVVLALGLALVLGSGFTQPARASSEDVAMFYDDLGQYGQWVDYENYGPVWAPSKVSQDWRPYTDGRWVPTNDGYVFESQEPWGWATYHYGNWMPTPGYGWVWVPGRTWYPSTVDWRTSPETEAVGNSYVGWAPIPPPDYVPAQGYGAPGYYPGAPVADALTSPLWIFARAASFLLGFGQPYTPAYSYGDCGCLAPSGYVPTFFPQTQFVPSYYTPSYYPQTYFGGAVAGAYSYGPPVSYISRVSNINQTVMNNTIINNSANITRIHNVVPPQEVLGRNAGLRQITPPALLQGQALPPARQLTDVNAARANLGKPNIVYAPKNVPPLKAQIPKAPPLAAQPVEGGLPGAALPSKATMKLSPQQQAQVQKLPPQQQIKPVAPPLKPTPGQPAGPAGAKPGIAPPGAPGKPGQVQPGAPGPGVVQPGGKPGQVQPGGKPGVTPAGPSPSRPATPAISPQVQPGKPPVQPGAKPQPQPQPRPQPQARPQPQPQPQHVAPQPQPRPQPQPQPRPQPQERPQPQPRPQPQARPQPQPQPQHVAPQPRPQPQERPQPQPQARPQPQPQPQARPQPQQKPQEQKKPGEQ